MARKKRPRYPAGHPKAGQFMSNRAIAARKGGKAAARKRKRRKSTKARRRSTTRANPPRRPVDIVGSLVDGSVEATQILIGKAAARSVPGLMGMPKQGNVGVAVQAAVALASGYVASMFMSENAARAIMAGGLTAPIETLVVSYQVPWLSSALSPTTAQADVGRYVGRGGGNPGAAVSAARRRTPEIADRGLGAYVSSEERGIPAAYSD